MSKRIPLTQGQFAIVDDENYEFLNQWKWYALWKKGTKSFYAARNSKLDSENKRIKIYMAIVIMKPENGIEVDHKNHNTLDNRKINLRNATRSQNVINEKRKISMKTGFRGVDLMGKKYRAKIMLNYKCFYLGTYTTPYEASLAYIKAAEILHGEFRYQERELCR
jgi:hypothetical protein